MSSRTPARSSPSVSFHLVQSDHESRSDDGRSPILNAEDSPPPSPIHSASLSNRPVVQENSALFKDSHEAVSPNAKIAPRSFIQSWFLEIAAVLISFLSFQAAIGVMIWANNRLLSSWHFRYSINTVVSILTTISRTTLAYVLSACLSQQKWNAVANRSQRLARFEQLDAASRGPLGGVKLIISLGPSNFIVLGAFATIATLAFEPFLQSMVTYQGQLGVTSASGSLVNKLLRLNIGTATFDHTRPSDQSFNNFQGSGLSFVLRLTPWSDNQPDLGLSTAIKQGFSNTSQSEPTVSAVCGSQNCTWPTYHSLDICGTCTSVVSHIARKRRVNLNNADFTWARDLVDGNNPPVDDCIWKNSDHYPYCFLLSSDNKTVTDDYNRTYSVNPDNAPVSYTLSYQLPSVGFKNNESAFIDASRDQVIVVNTTSEPRETITFQNVTTLLSAFTIMKAPDLYLRNRSAWSEISPDANECGLYFCVNEYNVTMVNGALQQVTKPAPFRRNPTSFGNLTDSGFINESIYLVDASIPYDRFYNISTATKVAASWFDNPSLWDPKGSILGESLKGMDLQLISDNPEGIKEVFNISADTVVSTIQLLLSWTVGHSVTDEPLDPGLGNTNFISRPMNRTGDSFIDMLYESTNISATFEKAVRRMSSYVQNIDKSSQAQRAVVIGSSQKWDTHITIQWPYITLPAITLLAGYAYVIITMYQTWRLGVRPWKDSPLPMLSHGLSEEAQQLLRNAELGGCLDAVQKAAWLRLEGGRDGRLELSANPRVLVTRNTS